MSEILARMEMEILFFLLQFFFEKDGISTKEKKDCNVQRVISSKGLDL